MKIEELKKYLCIEGTPLVDAMQMIGANAKGFVFIVNNEGELLGTLTDGDVRRWIIKIGDVHTPVEQVMNRCPKFIYTTEIAKAAEYLHKYQIHVLPIVTPDHVICDLYTEEHTIAVVKEKKDLSDVTVIIMAGGKGTRLYPYTKILPKPLIPIGDIPIMERIIDRFRDEGVNDFVATVNYRKNMIKSYFAETTMDYHIEYIEEEKPLGTAGSLNLIKRKFGKAIFVTNCDILIQVNYGDLYSFHEKSGNDMTIVSALKSIVVPYGVIHTNEGGLVEEMEEKPKLTYFINTGMYIINPNLINEIPEDTFFHMTDLTDKLIKEGKQVGMYPISEASFLDMGEFEEMRRMEQILNLKSE